MNGDDPVFDQNTTVNVGTDEYDGKYAENFRQYTDDMLKFIQDTGRDVRLWGSLSMRKGSTPVRSENVQMNIWNTSWANPNEMYKQGFDLINMVDGTLYMVPGAGYYNDYLNSQNIYNNWQPNNMGGTIIPAGDEQMLGSAYAIWNDMVDKKANGISEYDIYDRFEKALPAMSSKLWGDGQDLKYNELNEVVNSLGTAPNSNPRDVVTSKSDTVLNYDFNKSEIVDKSGNEYNVVNKKNVATVAGKFSKGLELSGGESYIETPLADMGPNNSVSFWVKMDKDATGEQVLFESDKGSIKMSQKDTGKVGFSRIGYDYSFNYELPKDEWVKLEINGYANKAELYVNGELVDTLAKNATGGKYATLTLPLERIGSKTTSFKGIIDNLEISTTGSQSDDTDYTKVDSSNFTVSTDNENPQAGNEGPITYAFDNNEVTFWHSNYSPYQALPATVEIDMKEVHTINQFDYLPRQDGNTNGQIIKYELYIKENAADEYQKVSEGELAANASLKKITFDAANARYIKFVALEGTGNGGKSFACASEFTVRQIDSKAELRKVVNLAANYEKEYYTTASWNDFETALTNAIDELELKTDVSVDKTDLEALLNICGTIDLNNYQENGKAEFKAAYEYALSIFNEADATEQEIRDAMNRLLEAKKNLKEIEVTPTDPDKNGQDKPIDNKVETGDNINVLYSASGLALASIVFYFSKKRKRSN